MRRILLILAAAAGLMTGCGGGDRRASPAAMPHAGALDAREAERVLADSFRSGLSRLAVITQPGEDAADLGRQLPTGLVDRTRCDAGGSAARTARCTVRWVTVDGHARRTRYRVQLTSRGCLYAHAGPALRQVYDATTHAPSEHPLDFLVGTIRGC
ncbi:MAG: hypothetical protein QOE86_2715 [Solirubrobacteraceae bacterium]|nr:hypothetical protein [Solirubrobacteraceae bacterium]